jgi:septum formation protein
MISLILASNSPRRAFLLSECGFKFSTQPTHISEDFDEEMAVEEVPAFIAMKKAEAALITVLPDQLILTADTVVIFEGSILNKPKSPEEAIGMLSSLSGNTHKVITAVCLATANEIKTMEEISWVTFLDLKKEDIKKYVEHFNPLDKAGAYGAQECLPENYNPCSGHERDFLLRINKLDMLKKSKPDIHSEKPLVAIQEIAGSYFNVMGLPIANLYDKLMAAL